MKKAILIFTVIMLTAASNVNAGGLCVRQVNPENNGACDLEYEIDENGNLQLTKAACIFLARNAFDEHDCILLFEPFPSPNQTPSIQEA